MKNADRQVLRRWWRVGYMAVQVRPDGSVWGKQGVGAPWGLLEEPKPASCKCDAVRKRGVK